MNEDKPTEAAEEAVDPQRLLDGEDPATRDPEEVRMWAAVYAELSAFKDDLVTQTEARRALMRGPAAREVEQTDLPVMRAEAARLRRQLEYWTRRAAELDH